jgi:ACS family glucarate transporter-like MFS transporter
MRVGTRQPSERRTIPHVSLMKPTTIDSPATVALAQPDNFSTVTAPNSRRWQVVFAVVVVAFLTILARAGISGAKIEMARDLGISELAFGLVFGAFALGYAVFMLPCGLLADRWGPRNSLTLSVFFWSLFTLFTGLATGVTVLIGIRFLFGLAEAGVFPQATRALHNWTLPRERGLALGLLNMGSRLGAAFGLAFAPRCVEWLGWRRSFVWLGVVGVIWAAVWYFWFRDQPIGKIIPSAGKKLSSATSSVPWRAFFSSRNTYLITYQYFASQFTFFICLSWLLPFLKTHYSISNARAGTYASIPLYCGALAMWSGGTLVDWLYKRRRWKMSRALPAMVGFGLATVTLIPSSFMHSPASFIACFALTTFGLDMTVSPSWTVCCDVGGRYSGTLSAAMNTMGALGSLASSLLFPMFISWAGNIRSYFYLAALLNVVALVCWKYIDPAKTMLPEEKLIELTA